jgi:nucleoside-diphosphate-sugar epimerase
MLTHHFQPPGDPGHVAVIGAGGFVGKAVAERLLARRVSVVGIARQDVDLLSGEASARLASMLQQSDTIVMIAAQAPVKNSAMLIDNLRMMAAVCAALGSAPVKHVIYVSSDAVYADADVPLSESSCAQPGSLHGVMHLAREVMLADASKVPLCILRPTLIYGANDPHNGYGPNRFRRLAQRGEEIVLFGEGEERRDHVFIDDVAELIVRCVTHRSEGILNIATGRVTTFREIAEKIAAMTPQRPAVRSTSRSGPLPHRGYRAFDASSTFQAFPDFDYTPLEIGLKLSQNQEFNNGRN